MIQRRLLLIVLTTVGAAIAALLVGFNIILGHTLTANAESVLRSRAAAQLELVDVSDGTLRLADAPNAAAPDTGAWVVSSGRLLERPRARRAVDAAAIALATGITRPTYADVPQLDVRLYARPVFSGGTRVGAVVVPLSLTPYEDTRRTAFVSSLIFAVLVLLLVALAARWLLASALRPVARMTRQAATWSERDLDRRFGLGDPRDELTELAATLDGLLDRLAASLRHEQRFSAELSHELRTPLSRVLAETELALRRERTPEEYRETLRQVLRNGEQLNRTIDALLAAARYEAGTTHGTADALDVATEAASACAGLVSERSLAFEIAAPDRPIRIGVEGDYAERILQPVFENACRYGTSTVNVTIERDGSGVRYSVLDDGPGVEDADLERIFEPGVRGQAANGSGSGLGLSLARRLAESVAGEIEAVADASGGRFVVRLPAG
jgi:two-component system, OmpR family, sensor kinase